VLVHLEDRDPNEIAAVNALVDTTSFTAV